MEATVGAESLLRGRYPNDVFPENRTIGHMFSELDDNQGFFLPHSGTTVIFRHRQELRRNMSLTRVD